MEMQPVPAANVFEFDPRWTDRRISDAPRTNQRISDRIDCRSTEIFELDVFDRMAAAMHQHHVALLPDLTRMVWVGTNDHVARQVREVQAQTRIGLARRRIHRKCPDVADWTIQSDTGLVYRNNL